MSTTKRALRPGDVVYWKESNRCGIVVSVEPLPDGDGHSTAYFNIYSMATGKPSSDKIGNEYPTLAPKKKREQYFKFITDEILSMCGHVHTFTPTPANKIDLEDSKKIVRLMKSKEPVFIPLTKKVRQMPVQDNCYYLLAANNNPDDVEVFSSDYGYDSVALPRELADGEYTHVAIIEKPKFELPKKVKKDMVWTAFQERELQKAKEAAKGGKK